MCLGVTTLYWQVHKPLLHWLHLVFFSRHRTQALFLASLGGDGKCSSSAAFFFDFVEVESLAEFEVFTFFVFDLLVVSAGLAVSMLLQLRFTEVFGASGDVDMSRFEW